MVTGTKRQNEIKRLSTEWKPHEMRDVAVSLLRLADSLDQYSANSIERSVFDWPSTRVRIEGNATNLAEKARLITERRERRINYISNDLLGEPAWDMLLDLFIQFARGAKISTTSLCIASRAPLTTALRYISVLEEKGYVTRNPSRVDKRVTFVDLTDLGVLSVGQYLEGY